MTKDELKEMECAYATALIRTLKSSGVKFLRYFVIDCCNNVRCKAIPINHLLVSKNNNGNGNNDDDGTKITKTLNCQTSIAAVCFAGLPNYADYMIDGTGMDARNVLPIQPDLHTLRILPYASKTAQVFGNVLNQYDNTISPLCTRSILSKVIENGKKHNIAFSVGAEFEFQLRDRKTNELIDDSVFANSTTLNMQETYINDLYEQLQEQDINIELIHSESGPGQIEIVLKYLYDPIQLVDTVYMTKETIIAVANKHKLKAIFIPKYDLMKAGNGLHIHMSLRDNRTNKSIFSDTTTTTTNNNKLSLKACSFIEGILQHLPAIMGLTLPTTNSFKRVGKGCWTGSVIGWAVEDKESGLRVCSNLQTKELDNIECKLCDSTCNLYLGLAAFLSCGLQGIIQNLTLRPSLYDNDNNNNDDTTTPSEPLPKTVVEALNKLEQDEFLTKEVLNPILSKGYIALRKHEAERAEKLTLEEEVAEALARA